LVYMFIEWKSYEHHSYVISYRTLFCLFACLFFLDKNKLDVHQVNILGIFSLLC
jgi:hypothetical protein